MLWLVVFFLLDFTKLFFIDYTDCDLSRCFFTVIWICWVLTFIKFWLLNLYIFLSLKVTNLKFCFRFDYDSLFTVWTLFLDFAVFFTIYDYSNLEVAVLCVSVFNCRWVNSLSCTVTKVVCVAGDACTVLSSCVYNKLVSVVFNL